MAVTWLFANVYIKYVALCMWHSWGRLFPSDAADEGEGAPDAADEGEGASDAADEGESAEDGECPAFASLGAQKPLQHNRVQNLTWAMSALTTGCQSTDRRDVPSGGQAKNQENHIEIESVMTRAQVVATVLTKIDTVVFKDVGDPRYRECECGPEGATTPKTFVFPNGETLAVEKHIDARTCSGPSKRCGNLKFV